MFYMYIDETEIKNNISVAGVVPGVAQVQTAGIPG